MILPALIRYNWLDLVTFAWIFVGSHRNAISRSFGVLEQNRIDLPWNVSHATSYDFT